MKCFLSLIFITVTLNAFASDTLFVKVINENNELIQGVSYEIRNANEQTISSNVSTDGSFLFVPSTNKKISIILSHVEYEKFASGVIEVTPNSGNIHKTFQLIKKSNILNEVVVSSTPRVATQKIDRLVINVASNPINTGASTLDVLEKSPGISTDRDGNFTLKGKQKVLVMIDDKPTFMSGETLKQYLSNLPASDVKQIELLDNPPAKYEASGNGGVINIVTNKKTIKGWNGMVNLGYMHSRFHKTQNSLQLNYGSDKLSFQFGYRQLYNEAETSLHGLRVFFEEDGKTIRAYLNQPTMFKNYVNNHQFSTAVEYQTGKKSSLNLNFTGTVNVRNNPNEGPAEWMDANKNIDSTVYMKTYFENDWNSIISGLGYTLNISKEQKLSFDVNYLNYRFRDKNLFMHIPWGETELIPFNRGYLPLNQDIYVFRTDYSTKTKNDWNIEMGMKFTNIETRNFALYDNYDNQVWTPDTNRTNRFYYSENVYGAYMSADKKWGNWTAKLGLRLEHTEYDAKTISLKKADSTFDRKYTNLFPSIYLQREYADNRTLGISISRRIDRPAFSYLNPFIMDINKYTTTEGNPYILPQFTWNFETNMTVLDGLTTSLGYSLTKDYFSQLFFSTDEKRAVYTRGNVGRLDQYSWSTTYIKNIRNWWNVTFQSTLMYKEFDGYSWTNVKENMLQWQGSLTQQFKILKKWNAEISGNYISKHQLDLQEVLYPTGQVGATISRNIFKDNATIRLGIRDIFYTQAMEGYTDFKYFGEYFKVTRDSRMLTLNFTYRFGKKIKTVKSRSGLLADELNRTGS